MNSRPFHPLFVPLLTFCMTGFVLHAASPLGVKDDRRLFMPGSQPGSVDIESNARCLTCHAGYDSAVEPGDNWRGSMMAQAMRDPLMMATLTVAAQDSVWALGNPNAGDLCLRCHTPAGWLGGRSDPPNMTALERADFDGIDCDACHRMVDPFNGLRQTRGLPEEIAATAIFEADRTHERDFDVLSELRLFDNTPFLDSETRLPTHYGDGDLPSYVEAGGGQYFVSQDGSSRGPRFDTEPLHEWNYSRFHKSKYFCASCHDVSNPVLASLLIGDGVPERQAAASYFHVERTWSEFQLSAYGKNGGASTNRKIAEAGVGKAASCQDCHMRSLRGRAWIAPSAVNHEDLALHDFAGGNVWMLGILASLDSSGPTFDEYNDALLAGKRYSGAKIEVEGIQGAGVALSNGQSRAAEQLQMAADLVLTSDSPDHVTLRIQNNTGHKLISGFPEGRRMWLNVRVFNALGEIIDEINPYETLVIRTNVEGDTEYVSGGLLKKTRDDLVYEAQLSSSLTGEDKSFHFVLATGRHRDNRIPPKGFDIARAGARLVQPRWSGTDALDYFTEAEYSGGYDEVTFAKPSGAVGWRASLFYQTTSKEYIEFLRNEIEGVDGTLGLPTPAGKADAYIVQTDPFFESLKDWGEVIWDLWLHNGGSPPFLMTSTVDRPSVESASFETSGFRVRFHTVMSRVYRLQRATSMKDPDWTDVGSIVTGDGTVRELLDEVASREGQRFYRVAVVFP